MMCLSLLLLLACQFAQAVDAPAILPRDEEPSSCQSRRTVFNIIWGCVSTTIICAWTSVHPNMPPRESPLKRTLRRLELMLWTIFAPEIMPAWALNQRLASGTIRNVYNDAKGYQPEKCNIWKTLKGWVSLFEITDAVNRAWTLKHGQFLVMGGIHLVEPPESEEKSNSLGVTTVGNQESPLDAVSVERRAMDTERGRAPSALEPNPLMGSVTILTLEILEELVKDPEFEILLTEDEIMDKSKGDALAKVIFILQSSWFILQCVARPIQGLDLTQLELTTLALASLNAITFIMWWHKPLGAQTPARVYLKRRLTDREKWAKGSNTKYSQLSRRSNFKLLNFNLRLTEIRDIVLCRSEDTILVGWLVKLPYRILSFLCLPISIFVRFLEASRRDLMVASSFPVTATHVPTFYVPEHRYSEYWHILFFLMLGPVFGGIHCAGWTFHFPTATKRQLWRVASLAITAVPICPAVLLFISGSWKFVKAKEPMRLFADRSKFGVFTPFISVFLYMAARVMLIVLAIMLMTNTPAGALIVVDWTKFYPHVL